MRIRFKAWLLVMSIAASASALAAPKVESLELFKVSNDRAGISGEMKLIGLGKRKIGKTELRVNVRDAEGKLVSSTFVDDPSERFTFLVPSRAFGKLSVEVVLAPDFKTPLKTTHIVVTGPGAELQPITETATGRQIGSIGFMTERDWGIVDPKTGELLKPVTREPIRKEPPLAPVEVAPEALVPAN